MYSDEEPSLTSSDLAVRMAWIDSWARRNQPTAFIQDLADFESKHSDLFQNELGRLLDQSWVEVAALAQLVDQLNFVDRDWHPNRSVQFALLAHNLKSFVSALDRLSKGYAEDTLAIVRGLYEAFLRLVFISLHPEDPYASMGGKPLPGIPRFNVTNFAEQELRLEWTTYSILSGFAHSNIDETMLAIFESIDDPTPRRFGLLLSYDERLISAAAPMLQFVLLLHLRFATDVLCDRVSPIDENQLTVAKESVAVLTTALRTHPKPYWPSVADDVDYVFELMKLADAGTEWRHLPKTRPIVVRES